METCINCDCAFRKRTGGYYRYSLERRIESSGMPAREHLSELTGSNLTPVKRAEQFLCLDCWNKLNDTVRYKASMDALFSSTSANSYIAQKRQSADDSELPSTSFIKRPRYTSTPLKKMSLSTKKTSKSGKWESIITAVRARQYSRAILGLYNATKGSKCKFAAVVTRIVRKELNMLLDMREKFPLCEDVTVASISDFSWERTIELASEKAPVLFSSLKGAVTTKVNESTLIRQGKTNLKPRIGTALALLVNSKAPHKCNFFQTLMSVQFWRGRLRRDTIKQISKLGLCMSYEATLTAIDRIRTDFDSAAIKCKGDIETALKENRADQPLQEVDADLSTALSLSVQNVEAEIVEYPEMEDTVLYSDNNSGLWQSMARLPENSVLAIHASMEEDEDDIEDGLGQMEEDQLSDTDEEAIDEVEESEVDILEMPFDHEVHDESSQEMLVQPELGDVSMNLSAVDVSLGSRNEAPGFTMCWDNVGKKVVARHSTETLKNRYLNMALGYMAVNRVPSLHLNWKEDPTTRASDIPLDCFIPQQSDFDHFHYRMNVIVGRIICRHIPWFRDHFSDFTVPHIVHEHTAESARKSILVNLGVFKEDPCSTQGAIGIYEKLHNYVPVVDGIPVKTLVFGDGLSCERGNDAQCARSNGITPTERLEGLEPAAQEFHKEMILLQDFFDVFFKGSSSSNRGTLCQIKNLFNFRQVKSDIGDNFSHAWELMCTTVESFVCLLLMSNTRMEDVTAKPENAPENIETALAHDKSAYFDQICSQLVEKIWQRLNTDSLKTDDGNGPPVVCCGDDLDEEMIGCETRSSCPKGEFFHYSCAGIDPDNLPVPWYCSEECRNIEIQPYTYCVCGQDLGTNVPMIGCHLESLCTRKEWYHMQCIGIDPRKPPKGKWFCCNECRQFSKSKSKSKPKTKKIQTEDKEDLVQSYSLLLIWAGLNLLCRRDAVREGDGEAMIAFWRIDLVHFFSNKHPKCTILAHRLLAAVNGWMPDRIKYDLIHNRTVNYSGGVGRNLPLDFMNEVLNRLFKDLLECAKGRYTDTTIQRCSQIIGPLGEALDTVFDTNVIENEVYRHRRRAQNRDANVSRLISILIEESLFEHLAGRKHSAFSDFQYSVNARQSGRFAAKIKQLSKRLGRRRQIIINE